MSDVLNVVVYVVSNEVVIPLESLLICGCRGAKMWGVVITPIIAYCSLVHVLHFTQCTVVKISGQDWS